MEKYNLTAQKRSILGQKVEQLRKKGILPANLFGKKIKSQAIQLSSKDFDKIFSKAGESSLVELVIDKKIHPVLIHNVQMHPVTDISIHVDFFEVDLKEKVATKVPLVSVGESVAVKDRIGVLLTLLSEVEVEALPADLPDKIEVDISKLAVLDQVIKISELKVSDKIKILTDKDQDIIKVAPLVSKEAQKQAEEEAAAAAAAAAPTTVPETGKEAVKDQPSTSAPADTKTQAAATEKKVK